MISRRSALRTLAWLTLIYAILGAVICTFLWVPVIIMIPDNNRYDWNIIAWGTKIALFVLDVQLWVPAGVLLTSIAAWAFFRVSAGAGARRLLIAYSTAVLALAVTNVLLAVHLLLASPITISKGTRTRSSVVILWEDVLFWMVAGVLLTLPFMARGTNRLFWGSRKRPPEGICGCCGYDLTGNESGVCPECGSAMPGRSAQAEVTRETDTA